MAAKLYKLKKAGQTIFPVTVTDAVVDPDSLKTLTTILRELLGSLGSAAYEDSTAFDAAGDADAALQGAIERITADLVNYYTKSQMDSALAGKQDTINDLATIRSGAAKGDTSVQNTDVFPSGTAIPDNPTVQQRDQVATVGGLVDYVGGKGVEQIQSDWNQSDNTKKDYIKNKPSIPAAQVQSDWNQTNTEAVDYIKNKPTIPAAQVQSDWNATTGMGVILNKPTIPDAQVQSDWNQTTTTEPDYIKNKPTIPDVSGKADKVPSATEGNFAALDSNGNLTDSGHKHSDYLTSHQDISGKEDKMTIEAASGATLSAQVGKYYTLSSVGTLAITLPAGSGTKVQSIVFYMATGSSPAVTFSSTDSIVYSDGFSIEASNTYEVNALWNGVAWVVASVKIVVE